MKHAVVFDWDGVIFSDDAYKSAFVTALTKYVSASDVERLYKESKDMNGYNDLRLAEAIAEQTSVPVSEVQSTLDEVMTRTADEFIFDDARRLLTSDRPSSLSLIVLTAGDTRIQKAKIAASQLESYFDHIMIVPANRTEHAKESALSELTRAFGHITFFDDRLSTIEHIRAAFDLSRVTPIFVDRSTSADSQGVAVLPREWSELQQKY